MKRKVRRVKKTRKHLLVDVDSKVPNIALMKISQYLKDRGDEVVFGRLRIPYFPTRRNKIFTIDAAKFESVWASIVFGGAFEYLKIENNDNISFGGTGYDLTTVLSPEIEKGECDYSLYPLNEISYGFITRGCSRKCKFCIVHKKEGAIHQVNDPRDIIRHKMVKFLDNNILAFKDHKKILRDLIALSRKTGVFVDFNQGMDVRLIDDENAKLISELKYIGGIKRTFAFDQIGLMKLIEKKIKILKKYHKTRWMLRFFVYVHPDLSIADDVVPRLEFLKRHDVLPYLMRHYSCWNDSRTSFYTDLAGWSNAHMCFVPMSFSEYLRYVHGNSKHGKVRRHVSESLYKGKAI